MNLNPVGSSVIRAALLSFAVFFLTQQAFSQGPAVNSLSNGLSEIASRSGKKTVAVVDFTDLQGCVTELGRYMAEDVSVALVNNAKGFEVIDRTNLKVLMQEHKLAATGIIDPATARKLGQVAGVDALVTGTIAPLSDSVHVSAKVLDTETAKMLGGVTADIPRTRTVEDLLAKGVANCGPAPAETFGSSQISGGADSPQRPKVGGGGQTGGPQVRTSEVAGSGMATLPMSIHSGEFLVTLEGCVRDGNHISCSGSIVNNGQVAENKLVDAKMVDNLGYEYVCRIDFARSGFSHYSFEPDLPVHFTLKTGPAENVAKDAASVNIIWRPFGGNQSIFRNISLTGQ
jgi:TolB-like protein